MGQVGRRAKEFAAKRLEVSVKLSSVHPRYDAASYAQVRGELLDRLKQISGGAAAGRYRASRSTPRDRRACLFSSICSRRWRPDPALDRWGGLGLAVQAYQPRALQTVGRIAGDRRSPPQARRHADRRAAGEGRLLGCGGQAGRKSSDWSAIRCFTDKGLTDLSYLACARRLLCPDRTVSTRSSPRITR